ncbi:hypothetical protein ABRP55_20405 [Pectobacterium zantedeschiae]|uniref:hypothetical protein n=1 Tax=Pectobacterium zantedeschiae TaxID=2034769 RepID=UPI0032EAFBBA
MSGHTKGPWFVNKKNNIQVTGNMNVIQTHGDDCLGYHIAYATGWEDNKENAAEAKCNASLIAAAPDLLEALRQLYDMVEDCMYENRRDWKDANHPMSLAKSAISKAKGES